MERQKRQHHQHLLAIVGACTALWATSAHAQNLMGAQSSITNLRFELVDLDPADGVAPSIRFGNDGTLRMFAGNPFEEPAVSLQPGNVFGQGSGTLVSPDGRAITGYAPSALQSTSSITGDSVRNVGGVPIADTSYMLGDEWRPGVTPVAVATAGVSTQLSSWGLDLNNPDSWRSSFVLSPHTQLVIRGDIAKSAQLDASTLVGGRLVDGVNQGLYDLELNAFYGTTLSLISADGTYAIDAVGSGMGVLATWTLDGLTYDSAMTTPDLVDNYDVVLNMVNDGDTDQSAWLHFRAETTASLLQYNRLGAPVPTPDPVLVPEPSTYALMGLGLVGVVAVTRRRHARA